MEGLASCTLIQTLMARNHRIQCKIALIYILVYSLLSIVVLFSQNALARKCRDSH